MIHRSRLRPVLSHEELRPVLRLRKVAISESIFASQEGYQDICRNESGIANRINGSATASANPLPNLILCQK